MEVGGTQDRAVIDALVGLLRRKFSWEVGSADLELVDRWESRTATFFRHRIREAAPSDVLLKVLSQASGAAEEARSRHEELSRLEEGLRAIGGLATGAAAKPRGWTADPPAIALTYIPGTGLGAELRACCTEGHCGPTEGLIDAIDACGRILGVFHQINAAQGGLNSQRIGDEWLDEIARRVLLRRQVRRIFRHEIAVARSFGDFAPYNFILTPAGVATLIDPPAPRPYAPVYRDIAWFVFEMRRGLRSHQAPVNRVVLTNSEDRFREAFLHGYSMTGPVDPRDRISLQLISLFLSYRGAVLTRKRLLQRRYSEAQDLARQAREDRRRVTAA